MFVAMSGFALVVRTRSTAGGFVGIKSKCTRNFTGELRPGTEPRNLVLLALLLGGDRHLVILTGLVGPLVIKQRGPVIPRVRIEGIGTLRGIGIRTRGVRLAPGAKLQGGLGLRHPVLQQSMHAGTSHVGIARVDKSANLPPPNSGILCPMDVLWQVPEG